MHRINSYKYVTYFFLLALPHALQAADIDVAGATARYEQRLREANDAQINANTEEQNVHNAETTYYNAISEEQLRQDELNRQLNTLHEMENELPALQAQVRDLNNRLKSIADRQTTTRNEIASLENQKAGLETRITKLKDDATALQNRIAALQQNAAPIEQSKTQLQANRQQVTKQIAATQNEKAQTESTIASNQAEIQRVTADIATEKAKQAPDQGKIAQLQSRIQTLRTEKSQLESTFQSNSNKISNLKAELSQKQNAINNEKQKLGPVNNKIEAKERDINQLNQRKNQLTAKKTAAQNDINNANKEQAQLNAEIAKEKSQPKPDKQKINKLENQLNKAEQDEKAAQRDLDVANRELAENASKLTEAQNELAQLKASVAPTLNAIAQLEREAQQINGAISQAQTELQNTQTQIQNKNNQIASLERELAQEQAKQGPDASKIARLEQRKTVLTNSIADLNRTLNAQNTTIANLNKQIDDIDRQISQLDSQLQPIQQNIQSLTSQLNGTQTEIANLRAKRDAINNSLNDLRNTLVNLTNSANQAQQELNTVQFNIDHHDERVRRQNQIVRQAADAHQRAKQYAIDATSRLDQAKRDRDHAVQLLNRAIAQRDQAYNYLQQVIVNYEQEKARISQLAMTAGDAGGTREASERAQTTGANDGASQAQSTGYNQGVAEAKVRDERKGYREGRSTASTEPTIKANYDAGLNEGAQIARQKAAAEDLPKGYNAALANLKLTAPTLNQTLDISTGIPQDPGGSGAAVSPNEKIVGSVPVPSFQLPLDPPYVVPGVTPPSASIPARDNRYYAPPCTGLQTNELQSICTSNYEAGYDYAFQSRYAATYATAFSQSFGINVQAAYDNGLQEAFADLWTIGLKNGAKDQGILDGFQAAIAKEQQQQFANGQSLLTVALSGGNFLILREATLEETNGDGVISAGETVKLRISIDNYGGEATKLGTLRLRLKNQKGLEGLVFEVRDLPALASKTRTTLTGVLEAKVQELVAGEKISLECTLETVNGETLGVIKGENTVHFPIELTALTLDKVPRVGEVVGATARFKNLANTNSATSTLKLVVSPNIVSIQTNGLEVPALATGQEANVRLTLKPGVWVGENTAPKFLSTVSFNGLAITQPLRKAIHMDRFGSLLLFDTNGNPVPTGTLNVRAGEKVSFLVQLKGNQVASTGPVKIEPTLTSDPSIALAGGSQSTVNYGMLGAGFTGEKYRYIFNVPESQKGKSGYVMIQLSEGSQAIHALQVLLNIQ